MVQRVKTTLNLDAQLLRQAKDHAAARGTTLTSVVEEALRSSLLRHDDTEPYRLELPVVRGDAPPAVDVAHRDELEDLMARRG